MELTTDTSTYDVTVNTSHHLFSPRYVGYQGNKSHYDQDYVISRYVTKLAMSYVLPTVCCFGIVGNMMILIILTKYRVRRTVSIPEKVVHAGLITMAVSDLLFNISVLPLAFVADGSLMLPAGSFHLFYNLYSTGFITTFSLTSTWLIVVTAGLRYLGVCHPLQSRYLITRKAIFISIGVICLVCVLVNVPQFLIQRATPLYEQDGYVTMLIDLGPFSHENARGVIYSWIRAFFAIFIPGILLIYFNTRLLMALHASRRLHRNHVIQSAVTVRRETGSSNRLTRTLVAVIIMFIVLVYPDSLLDFFTYVAPLIDIKNNESVMIARVIVNMLQITNYAFNFVLYCVMNATFRRALRELICWCLTAHTHRHNEGQLSRPCHKLLHPLLKNDSRYLDNSSMCQRTAMTIATMSTEHRIYDKKTSCSNV
ncbi:hypothetical protein LSH36_1128g00006 [Paralvinella palmiformis]|uniref:G-protein coupled receptors family 1 profile domain-containing protein n=1 Tax=Paralvinella palmiformis TaxID=53620 RepID=A0AAD9IVV5_9ANNE|nr:hypothetical protein LSH36_1128g00006 [Paralvinella palmiformis]